VVIVAALGISATARAQERITLADGTVMQGELVEKVPGHHITIKLVTGEVRTIQWGALAPQPPTVSPFVQPIPMSISTAPTGPSVHVVIDADRPGVTLVRVMGFGMVQAATSYGTAYGAFEQSRPVCVAPCQADVEAGGLYRIAGEGITATSTFGLPAQPSGAVRLHIHGGSLGARIGALWLMVGGITFATTGGLLAGLGAADSTDGSNTGVIASGLVLAGLGVVALAIGIPLFIGSNTSVVTDDGMVVAKLPAGLRF